MNGLTLLLHGKITYAGSGGHTCSLRLLSLKPWIRLWV